MDSYFSKQQTGGAINSGGFKFQDLCAASALLEYIEAKNFKCVTLEQIEDYTLLFNDYEVVVQAKDTKLHKSDLQACLNRQSEEKNDDKSYAIVCSSWQDNYYTLIRHISDLNECIRAERPENEIKKIREEVVKEIKKLELPIPQTMNCSFKTKSRDGLKNGIDLNVYRWLTNNGYTDNYDIVVNELLKYIADQRVIRGSISKQDFVRIVERVCLREKAGMITHVDSSPVHYTYEELAKILNEFPDWPPQDIMNVLEFPPCYYHEAFDATISSLRIQNKSDEEDLRKENIDREYRYKLETEISNREYAIGEIEKIKSSYLKAKEDYLKLSESGSLDLYASMPVINALNEFKGIIHNAFISGISMRSEKDKNVSIVWVARNNVIQCMRDDIGLLDNSKKKPWLRRLFVK